MPASVGVQIAHPDSLVINVAGEASWLMNMQEMGTAVQYRLPVKQFILNNERLGMVRQWQELLHGERYSHSWSTPYPILLSWQKPLVPRASVWTIQLIWMMRSWEMIEL